MFLTTEQITALTGKQQPAAQHRALNAMGIIHKIRPDGSIVVLILHLEKELGALASVSLKKTVEAEPNWEAL